MNASYKQEKKAAAKRRSRGVSRGVSSGVSRLTPLEASATPKRTKDELFLSFPFQEEEDLKFRPESET